MDEQTLVIYYDSGTTPVFRKLFSDSGIRCRSWLKNNFSHLLYRISGHVRYVGRLWRNLIYYYPKNRTGLIIIFDTKISIPYISRVRKYNPKAKIILWYWNEISEDNRLIRLSRIDTWSFSPYDCIEYGLLYNSQFYFDSLAERYRDIREQGEMRGEQSFIFMGREKGRSEQIRSIADEIIKCGWGCKTEYLSTNNFDRFLNEDGKYTPGFGYEKYLEEILKYKGILDVACNDNSGLSLRVFESVFFHKKLITNNPLVTAYDFYDENNIYIWDHSKISLEEFLARPYRPVPDSICRTYLLSSWLARFKAYYKME